MGSLVEKSQNVYEGKILFPNLETMWIRKNSIFQNTFLFSFFSLLDIPKESPVLNLNKMVNLDTKQLHTETTGEKIVKQLQEYLLNKVSANEWAVLPEDKIQCLLVGVTYFLTSRYLKFFKRSSIC